MEFSNKYYLLCMKISKVGRKCVFQLELWGGGGTFPTFDETPYLMYHWKALTSLFHVIYFPCPFSYVALAGGILF